MYINAQHATTGPDCQTETVLAYLQGEGRQPFNEGPMGLTPDCLLGRGRAGAPHFMQTTAPPPCMLMPCSGPGTPDPAAAAAPGCVAKLAPLYGYHPAVTDLSC